MEKAVRILDEMNLAGVSPDEHTYTTLMKGYASLGDTEKAFRYFTILKNDGLEIDVYTYEALLKACCKSGRMQSALAVTKEMSAKKIPRNTFVYNILIDGYNMNNLHLTEFNMNLYFYVTFGFGCIFFQNGTLYSVLLCYSMFTYMHIFSIFSLMASQPNYNIVLNFSWARRGDVWEAADLMQQMRKEGVQPDIHTYTSFINACCKAGDMLVCLLMNIIYY